MSKEDFPWIKDSSTNPIDKKMKFNNVDIFSINDSISLFEEKTDKKNEASQDLFKAIDNKNEIKNNLENNELIQNLELAKPKEEGKEENTNSLEESNFISLAIKYRPKNFKELIGQDSIAQTLSLALDNKKISNAYLFSGLRGSGKTSSARIFAKCLQCEAGISSNPCLTCDSCKASIKQNHMDIIELDAASNRGIDDVRDIIDQTRYNPSYGRFKIFIIDEVHMLTNQAFNALLKILEEPPSHVKFILATTDPLKVPVTILSRVQHFRFKKIQNTVLKQHIKYILEQEKVYYEEEILDLLIRSGDGSVRDTITNMEQAIIYCNNNITLKEISKMLGALNPSSFDVLLTALAKNDKTACMDFIAKISEYNAEMIIDELSIYIKNKLLEDDINLEMGMKYAYILSEAKYMLKNDFNEEFLVLLTILKMIEANKIQDKTPLIKEEQTIKPTPQISQTLQRPESLQSEKIEQSEQGEQVERPEKIERLEKSEQNPAKITQESNQNADNTQESSKQENINSTSQKYETLITKLYDRDYEMGKIFEEKIRFKDFQEDILYLDFYTSEQENQNLRRVYSTMLEIIRSIFGENTKLKVDKKAPNIEADNSYNNQENYKNELEEFKEQNKEVLELMNNELGINRISIIKN